MTDESAAACNLIPSASQTFRGAVGALNRPFAGPGDFVEIGVEPGRCDASASGFAADGEDHVVNVVFTPAGSPPRERLGVRMEEHMGDVRQGFAAWMLVAIVFAGSGCGPKRITGPGRMLTDCDYLVVTEKHAHRFADEAEEVLNKSFVVVKDDDLRLKSPALKAKACLLQIEWSRGFWKSSATVDVKDYSNRALMHRSYVAGGMLYAGYAGDIMEALEDVGAARAEGGPVPAAARAEPLPIAEPQRGIPQASKAQRLTELNDLKDRGLISDDEYSEQRAKILNER